MKKLPIAIGIPAFLSSLRNSQGVNALDLAIGDLSLVVFYYLLQVSEYTIKGSQNITNK